MTKYHVTVPVHVLVEAGSLDEAKEIAWNKIHIDDDNVKKYPVHDYMIDVSQDMNDRVADWKAAKSVVDDQRLGWDNLAAGDAIRQARDTVSLIPGPGATVVDDDSPTAGAYRRVLGWSEEHAESMIDRLEIHAY